jgi:hypothetical protein
MQQLIVVVEEAEVLPLHQALVLLVAMEALVWLFYLFLLLLIPELPQDHL